MITPRSESVAVNIPHKGILVLGGRLQTRLDTVELLEFHAHNKYAWHSIAPMLTPKISALAAYYNKFVFVCQFFSAEQDLEVFNTYSGQWTRVSCPNQVTRCIVKCSLTVFDGKLLLGGRFSKYILFFS